MVHAAACGWLKNEKKKKKERVKNEKKNVFEEGYRDWMRKHRKEKSFREVWNVEFLVGDVKLLRKIAIVGSFPLKIV